MADQARAGARADRDIQREDLNPAPRRRKVSSALIGEFGLRTRRAAQAIGRLPQRGHEPAALSRTLASRLQAYLLAGKLDIGHARALLALPRRHNRLRSRREVVAEELSVR